MMMKRAKNLLLATLLVAACTPSREGSLIRYVDTMVGTGERIVENGRNPMGFPQRKDYTEGRAIIGMGKGHGLPTQPRMGMPPGGPEQAPGTPPGIPPGAGAMPRGEQGQTLPAVLEPNGMNFWTPQTESVEIKGRSPYYYGNNKLQGFRASHWIVGGCTQDYGSFTVMPTFGTLKCLPEERASEFSHKDEISTPAYYQVPLFDGDILAEMTGTSRAGIFRFTYPKAGKAYLVLTPNSDEASGGVEINPDDFEITATNPVHRIYQGNGEPAGFSGYCSMVVSKKPVGYGVYQGETVFEGRSEISRLSEIGAWLEFDVEAGEEILVKMSTSFCDYAGARNNREEEISGWDFDAVRTRLEQIWEDRLSAIVVKTDDEEQMKKFYTSLYHASFLPHAFNDADGRYPSFAGGKTIEKTSGTYYDDYSLWDTYRALHPLLGLLYPEQTGEMIQSLINKYEQGGWLPIFPAWNSYTSEMIGDHCASLIADAYVSGIRNFDLEKAYVALRQNAFQLPDNYKDYTDGKGRRALDTYLEYGYIPLEDPVMEAYHHGEQVSRTLEYAYDDFALARFAEALGKEEDAKALYERARYYRNVIDPRTGWAQGRFADGTFLNERNEHEQTSFITEGTPSQYSWYVPQDVYGLMDCMGGKAEYLDKLDEMFQGKHYNHGNEPSHQIAYMYNYAGQPWRTQEEVRNILENEYHTGADGLSGNDDAGQMSAWYIFSALGFYPVCPASGQFILASPTFEKATLRMSTGKTFTIEARNASKTNIYVQKVTLNGEPYGKNYITHEDIATGGKMVFVMGPAPDKDWGSSPEDCPEPVLK